MKWDIKVIWHLVYFSLYENLNIFFLVQLYTYGSFKDKYHENKILHQKNLKKKKHFEFGHYHENVEVKYYKKEEFFSFFLFQFCNVA
jgi:hypothetical protein